MDVIVFHSVLTAQAIKTGANMRENIIEETSNSKKQHLSNKQSVVFSNN